MFKSRLAQISLVVAALALSGWAVTAATIPLEPGGESGQVQSLAPILKKVTPGVVNIAVRGTIPVEDNPLYSDPFFRRFFDLPEHPPGRQFQSVGSGVIADAARGYILTNNHVIARADEITVGLQDGRRLKAKLVGADPEVDIALLKVPAQDLVAVPLGDSDGLEVGDFVIAVGNPFGLGQTVTSGIVSALGRSGLGIEGYEDFIQTDAAINPGNSGGALIDLQGRLVGINTAIVGPAGGNVGIGFAIPINMARQIMEQIVAYGTVRRGQLGVVVQDLTPDLAEAFKLESARGTIVAQVVPGSSADKAGLERGDVIVAVDGAPVRNAAHLRNRIGLLRQGETVELKIVRNAKTMRITAKIGPRVAG
ncbi:MAG: Do family serine endopeptidase [Kiloniellaceae bacterium]